MVCFQTPRFFHDPYTSIDISWLRGRRESRPFIPLALNVLVLSMEEIVWIETSYRFSEQSIKRFNFPLLSCMISLCSLEKSILSPWLYHSLFFVIQSWNRLAGNQGRVGYSESASQRKTGSPGLALSCLCFCCYLSQNRWALTTEVLSNGCFVHASSTVQYSTPIGGTILTLSVTVTPITYEHFFKVLRIVSVISIIYKQIHIVFF